MTIHFICLYSIICGHKKVSSLYLSGYSVISALNVCFSMAKVISYESKYLEQC
jgi:hypothetical protein